MAKRQYGHQVTSAGQVVVVDMTLPRHLRGHSEYSTHTFKEGPLRRLLGKVF